MNRHGQQVSIKVPENIIESICEYCLVDRLNAKIGHDRVVGGTGLKRMSGVLPLQGEGRTSILIQLDKLQDAIRLNLKLALIPQKISIISKYRIISGP